MNGHIRQQLYLAARAQCKKDGTPPTNVNYLIYFKQLRDHLENETQSDVRDTYLAQTIHEIDLLERQVNVNMQGPEDTATWKKNLPVGQLQAHCRKCGNDIKMWHCENRGCRWCAQCATEMNGDKNVGSKG